jgi:hypothetical protein
MSTAQGDVPCFALQYLGIVVFGEGPGMFTLGAVAACGRPIPAGNLPFAKRTLFGCVSDSYPERPESVCLKDSVGIGRPCPF